MLLSNNPEQKEAINSIIKLLASKLPGGDIINEFRQYRSKLKQKRLNKFVESLQDYIQSLNFDKKIYFDLLQEEEFTDLFESVLLRVVQTNSFKKIDRFKIILANQLIEPTPIDYLDTYLDLVNTLSEKQIEILTYHKRIFDEVRGASLLEENNSIRIQLNLENELRTKGSPNKYDKIQEKLDTLMKYRIEEFYQITKGEYLFCVQDLTAKSLLIDYGIGGIGVEPYDLLEITEYGQQFLKFIEEG